MNLGYNTGIPNAPNNPSNDQPLMQTNTNSINSWVQVDHAGFQNNQGGYHTNIHMITQALSNTSTGTGQLYAAPSTTNFGTDNQLWFKTTNTPGASPGAQISGNNAVANVGWVFVGGMIFQWGAATIPIVTPTDVSFVPAFPTAALSVSITPQSINSNSNSFAAQIVDKTKFTIAQINGSNVSKTFYWFAIGY